MFQGISLPHPTCLFPCSSLYFTLLSRNKRIFEKCSDTQVIYKNIYVLKFVIKLLSKVENIIHSKMLKFLGPTLGLQTPANKWPRLSSFKKLLQSATNVCGDPSNDIIFCLWGPPLVKSQLRYSRIQLSFGRLKLMALSLGIRNSDSMSSTRSCADKCQVVFVFAGSKYLFLVSRKMLCEMFPKTSSLMKPRMLDAYQQRC